jgi:hypothetical protein
LSVPLRGAVEGREAQRRKSHPTPDRRGRAGAYTESLRIRAREIAQGPALRSCPELGGGGHHACM